MSSILITVYVVFAMLHTRLVYMALCATVKSEAALYVQIKA